MFDPTQYICSMASVKVICRSSKKNKEGKSPIVVRLVHNRKAKIYSSAIWLDRHKDWDDKNKKVKNSVPSSHRTNQLIHHLYNQVYDIALDLNTGRRSWDEVAPIQSATKVNIDFMSFGETLKERLLKNDQFRTWKRYNTVLKKLASYCGKPLTFEEVTVVFLQKYEQHLKVLGNRTNTIHTNLKTIRAILYQAIKEGHFPQEENPFFQFKLKKEKTKKARPTELDVLKLTDLTLSEEHSHLEKIVDVFLFSLYCAGIRTGDLLQLVPENIHNNTLRYKMDKTSEHRVIPLVPQALAIYQKYNNSIPSHPIFPFLSFDDLNSGLESKLKKISSKNAYINARLKTVTKLADLSLPLTMHMARHGFSELARNKGISIYNISKALGHSSIAITENYLKSFDEDATQETMNQIFNN